MTFAYLILPAIFCSVSSYGQSFQISGYVGPVISNFKTDFHQIVQDELKIDLGFSTGIAFEHYMTRNLALGTALMYNYLQGEFYTPCYYCVSTADRIISTRNKISTNNLEIPLFLKLRLSKNENKYFYLQSGIAMNVLISARRIVEIETDLLNGSDIINEEIADESFSLLNKKNKSIGSSFHVGIGRTIPIKKMTFYSELTFRKDINYWNYYAYQVPSLVEEFPIKNSSLLLKIGVFLKN